MNGHNFHPPLTETHLIITGIVQGVSFRATTKHLADKLHIKGYVRNLDNGCVEICITNGNVKHLITQLKQTPHPIRIDSIERRETPLSKSYASFEIRKC